jgi:hypothetical protein
VAAAGLSACHHPNGTTSPRVEAIEQMTVPLPPNSVGAIVSIRLANTGDKPVPARSLVPTSDPQISVEVFGLSDCRRGCVGTGLLDEPTEQQARASVDPSLRTIPPSSGDSRATGRGLLSLVVALRWRIPSAAVEPCRYLRSVSIRGERSVVELTAQKGGWLAAVVSERGPSDGPAC